MARTYSLYYMNTLPLVFYMFTDLLPRSLLCSIYGLFWSLIYANWQLTKCMASELVLFRVRFFSSPATQSSSGGESLQGETLLRITLEMHQFNIYKNMTSLNMLSGKAILMFSSLSSHLSGYFLKNSVAWVGHGPEPAGQLACLRNAYFGTMPLHLPYIMLFLILAFPPGSPLGSPSQALRILPKPHILHSDSPVPPFLVASLGDSNSHWLSLSLYTDLAFRVSQCHTI